LSKCHCYDDVKAMRLEKDGSQALRPYSTCLHLDLYPLSYRISHALQLLRLSIGYKHKLFLTGVLEACGAP